MSLSCCCHRHPHFHLKMNNFCSSFPAFNFFFFLKKHDGDEDNVSRKLNISVFSSLFFSLSYLNEKFKWVSWNDQKMSQKIIIIIFIHTTEKNNYKNGKGQSICEKVVCWSQWLHFECYDVKKTWVEFTKWLISYYILLQSCICRFKSQ